MKSFIVGGAEVTEASVSAMGAVEALDPLEHGRRELRPRVPTKGCSPLPSTTMLSTSPAERFDVVVDFSGHDIGDQITMVNDNGSDG